LGATISEVEYQANSARFRHLHTFSTAAELPIGRFRIFASATGGINWSRSWQDTKAGTIEDMLPGIAKEIRREVPVIIELAAEARRQADVRQQEWMAAEDRRKRAEDKKRIEESMTASAGQLQEVIEGWRGRVAVESFFQELERAIGLASEHERPHLMERLRLAKEFMGAGDPLDFFRTWKTPSEIHQPAYPDQESSS